LGSRHVACERAASRSEPPMTGQAHDVGEHADSIAPDATSQELVERSRWMIARCRYARAEALEAIWRMRETRERMWLGLQNDLRTSRLKLALPVH
jgi:hypothetical protein